MTLNLQILLSRYSVHSSEWSVHFRVFLLVEDEPHSDSSLLNIIEGERVQKKFNWQNSIKLNISKGLETH